MNTVTDNVEGNDFGRGDVLQTNGALAVEGAEVSTGAGWIVFVQSGIGGIGGVLLTADEVYGAICVGF